MFFPIGSDLQMLAEQAAATAEVATDEVQRLRRQVAALDNAIAAEPGREPVFEPYDCRGQRAWLPTGIKDARPGSAPPPLAATNVSLGGAASPASPTMSKLSRKLMEGSAAGTFLERLNADIDQRRDKIRAATGGGSAAAAEVAARDLEFCIELAAPRSTQLADALRHGSLVEVSEALEDVAEHYGVELGLSPEQVGWRLEGRRGRQR